MFNNERNLKMITLSTIIISFTATGWWYLIKNKKAAIFDREPDVLSVSLIFTTAYSLFALVFGCIKYLP